MTLQSLKLFDLSDREILHIVHGEQDTFGWASSYDIADRLGIDREHPAQCVGARLSWLKQYGVVEKHETKRAWRVTRAGRGMMNGELTDAQRRMLADMDNARTLMLIRGVTQRLQRSGQSAARLYDREWRYGTHHR